jgi:hypothetical protein
MRTPHLSCRQGKRVFVQLKDKAGTTFVDKFVESKGQYIVFENHRIKRGYIAVFRIYKPHDV